MLVYVLDIITPLTTHVVKLLSLDKFVSLSQVSGFDLSPIVR